MKRNAAARRTGRYMAAGSGPVASPGRPGRRLSVAARTLFHQTPDLRGGDTGVRDGRGVQFDPTTGHAGIAYGPGSTFGLAPTSFGLDLVISDLHHYYFCTAAERQAGTDQQYCGA